MRRQLLKGTLLLTIASIAAGLYLGMERKEPNIGLLEAAHRAADRPIYDGQHERDLLKKVLEKNPSHTPVLFRLAEIESEDGHLQEMSHLSRRKK